MKRLAGEAGMQLPAEDPKEAERCKVPEFAKLLGHEQLWKQHHQCRCCQ